MNSPVKGFFECRTKKKKIRIDRKKRKKKGREMPKGQEVLY